jgi:hypothetical protein
LFCHDAFLGEWVHLKKITAYGLHIDIFDKTPQCTTIFDSSVRTHRAMNTLEMKCEQIPVGQGKFITLESPHITINNFGTIKCTGPYLIHTNVIRLNANGLCAFCLEQKIVGDGWEEFEGYRDGQSVINQDQFHRFRVCNKCKDCARIHTLLECDGNWPTKTICMKYAREIEWFMIESVCYESD